MVDLIITPRRREDFFDERGEPTLRFVRWLELLTGQTNETVIDVINRESEITSTGSRVSRNATKIHSLELKEFEIIKTTTSLTTGPFQIIICNNTSSIQITLDTQAIEDDEVHIKRKDRNVDVIGLVDGKTNKTINVKYYSMHLVFNGTEWSEI